MKFNREHLEELTLQKIKEVNDEIDLHQTMDAQVWTKEFLKIFQKLYPDIYPVCTSADRFVDFSDWIHTWFCNLIMTGYDHAHWERDKRYVYILQSNSGEIVQIWNNGIEPNELEMSESYKSFLKCPDLPKINISCTLYRWSKHKGLQHWSGKATEETKYNWDS